MLPPVPTETLNNNPGFAALYTELTSRIIDPSDGSTRSNSRPNDEVDDELRTHRAELAKAQLLQNELEALTSRATNLNEDLQETLDFITSPFYRSLPESDRVLLYDEFEELEDALPQIGYWLSSSLQKSGLEIARIAYPLESPRVLEHKIDSLSADTANRLNALPKNRTALAEKQVAFKNLCVQILIEYQEIATRLLALLAQKSGTVAKALTAKSEHLAVVTESMYLKLNVLKFQALAEIYDPQAVNALENYEMHLRDTETRLAARKRTVEGELAKYKNAGSDMKGLVERYSVAMRAIDTVTKDIRRLGGKV